MEEDRRHPPQRAPLAHPLEVVEQALLRHSELPGGAGIRLGDDLHRPLGGADDGDVELGQLDRLRLVRLHRLGDRRERVGALLHLQVHADLEEAERGELAYGLGPRQAL